MRVSQRIVVSLNDVSSYFLLSLVSLNLHLWCIRYPGLVHVANEDFFFRPSPSRLLPGRNTVFVPVERIVQCLASFPLWGIKREHGPIRSPGSPSAMQSPKTNKTNKNLKETTNKPKPSKQHLHVANEDDVLSHKFTQL